MPDETKEPNAPNGEGAPSEETSGAYSSASNPYGSETPNPPAEVVAPRAEDPKPVEISTEVAALPAKRTPPPPPPPPPDEGEDEEDEEEKGMLRMSFMEHLEELRTRILRALIGVVVAFLASVIFCKPLWDVISAPAVNALAHLGINPPDLAQITPMESFNTIYLKLPLLVSLFLGSPWIFYQVWAFISPGLYKREKKWAVPFIFCTAGLFIAGGLFAYFVAFRFGLEFLLGIGRDVHVRPVVSISEYFDLFVNVTLGIGLVFEMPVIIFFLTLLRLASPRFLIRNSRYAILGITILAAVVTPTPDVFNMMIFAVPMIALFFVGVFASYLLVLKREGKKFPWGKVLLVLLGTVLVIAASLLVLIYRYHYHVILKYPYLIR